MPKRTDLHKILLIGSGPIVIGQACEFDYAGTQACMALRTEGYKVILINSNPATIMTDLQMADSTYIEPITCEFITRIIEKEKPCAILPTMGGQTALNVALDLAKNGTLAAHGVELLGATPQAIELAEDRTLFRQTIQKLGLGLPKSGAAKNLEEAKQVLTDLGLPIIVRPSFILGGSGSGIAHTEEEFISLCKQAFTAAPGQELLLDEALIGWKEFEMEVVRDKDDNCIIVCCIENIDPLGIHTGDSITVAPALTLTDKEYQKMRDASFAILRAIGVETGGSNVQFAIHPKNGKMVVIEMNPRVSRSSALASKATGFPIAKVAAKLAVGYTLSELSSELTGNQIPASFEPTIDYVVIKIPRFNFEKFKGCEEKLGTQMRSVGEAMAIGRTFQEALLKGMRSMEISSFPKVANLTQALQSPGPLRLWAIFDAFRSGMSLAQVNHLTDIDPWYLSQIEALVAKEEKIAQSGLCKEDLYGFKRVGFSDAQIASLSGQSEEEIRAKRKQWGIIPRFKQIDSCAAEFATSIDYLYSSYEEECEAHPTDRPKMVILGSGPSRIGQGIEFDYSCVHAIQTLKEEGYETIIVNCNPETVSTDYDCADKLYCAPLTAEDVLAIVDVEKPLGVIVQYGGQTPLNLAEPLITAGVTLLGMTLPLIKKTEDRESFKQFLNDLGDKGLKQPENLIIHSFEEAAAAGNQIGYPLIVRPSFVLGGRAMAIVSQKSELEQCVKEAFLAAPGKPVLLEHFLIEATEVDIDAICDGCDVYIPGILEHVEPAGIHSGDSACSLPPFSLSASMQKKLLEQTKKIALGLHFTGLLNIQFAIQGEEIFVLEVNPRASRTAPFTSKATGVDLIKIATRCLLGISLKEQGYSTAPVLNYFAVKEAVLPFSKFSNVDSLLGPEMKSTGEVMGLGSSFPEAYAKAQIASGYALPKPGSGAILDLGSAPEEWAVSFARALLAFPLRLYATPSTLALLQAHNVPCLAFGQTFGHAIDSEKEGEIQFIVALGKEENQLRQLAVCHRICHATTAAAAKSLLNALNFKGGYSLQSLHDLTRQETSQEAPRGFMLKLTHQHLITGEEFSPAEIQGLLKSASILKKLRKEGQTPQALKGKHLAMLFEKPSLRTRFSFMIAMHELGGTVVESLSDTRKKEEPEDLARVLAGYCNGVMIRTHSDEELSRMANVSKIPIINALSDDHHPCQILADLLTLQENFGELEGLKVAYLGDGNNILHSLLLMAPLAGIHLHYCCPTGREPKAEILATALERAASSPGSITAHSLPTGAVKDVHAVYTDVWTSMGFENNADDELFIEFQVNEQLMAQALPKALFMHCMPMVRGKEVSQTLPDSPQSVIFQQSENRLHVQKALLIALLGENL